MKSFLFHATDIFAQWIESRVFLIGKFSREMYSTVPQSSIPTVRFMSSDIPDLGKTIFLLLIQTEPNHGIPITHPLHSPLVDWWIHPLPWTQVGIYFLDAMTRKYTR